MATIFQKAANFLQTHKVSKEGRRKELMIKELQFILNTAPFLNQGEKERISAVLPFFNQRMLANVKQSLIKQGIRYLKEQSNG